MGVFDEADLAKIYSIMEYPAAFVMNLLIADIREAVREGRLHHMDKKLMLKYFLKQGTHKSRQVLTQCLTLREMARRGTGESKLGTSRPSSPAWHPPPPVEEPRERDSA